MYMTLDHAHYIAIWFEALLYGVYTCLFLSCFYVLYTRPVSGKRPVVMLSAMTLMYVLNTTHVAGTFKNVEIALFEKPPGQAAAFLADRAQPLNLLNKALYAAVLLLGDGLLIYRCWVIWQKRWLPIITPLILLFLTAATGFALVAFYAQLKPGETVFGGALAILTPATLALSLICNLITTGLIVYRIRIVSRTFERGRQPSATQNYKFSLAVIVESGAIYPLTLIIAAALYSAGSNAQAIFTGAMCQIVGIVPTLAILQIRLGLSRYEAAQGERLPSKATAVPSQSQLSVPKPPTVETRSPTPGELPMQRPSNIPHILPPGERDYDEYDSKFDSEIDITGEDEVEEDAHDVEKQSKSSGGFLNRPMSIHFQRTIVRKVDSVIGPRR